MTSISEASEQGLTLPKRKRHFPRELPEKNYRRKKLQYRDLTLPKRKRDASKAEARKRNSFEAMETSGSRLSSRDPRTQGTRSPFFPPYEGRK